MSEKNETRTKWLHIRLTDAEYKTISDNQRQSTCRKLSEYARTVLLKKPVVIRTRDASMDDFVAELIKLKNELNAIGNNFNQAVKKLHTLHQLPEFHHWLLISEKDKAQLFQKITEIKAILNHIPTR
jgi:hypothetical protein